MPDIDIRTIRDDKIEITIGSIAGPDRIFTLIVTQDGITINGDENLVVMPQAVNKIRVDYA